MRLLVTHITQARSGVLFHLRCFARCSPTLSRLYASFRPEFFQLLLVANLLLGPMFSTIE